MFSLSRTFGSRRPLFAALAFVVAMLASFQQGMFAGAGHGPTPSAAISAAADDHHHDGQSGHEHGQTADADGTQQNNCDVHCAPCAGFPVDIRFAFRAPIRCFGAVAMAEIRALDLSLTQRPPRA